MTGVISQPTMNLRFVTRNHYTTPQMDAAFSLRVLQQWWSYSEPIDGKYGEWRDVPLEVE